MPSLRVPLSKIHVPTEARIRDRALIPELLKKRQNSLLRFGQLQPIIVEPLDREKHKDIDKNWILVDGEIRFLSIASLSYRHSINEEHVVKAFEQWRMTPGEIDISTRDAISPVMSMMTEFHANDDRDDFTWDEKAKYIRRIHDMLLQENGKKWTAEQTAETIGQSPATVSHYLQLTDKSDPAAQSARVQGATTKGAALKQLQIEKEKNKRVAQAKVVEKRITGPDANDFQLAADLQIQNDDCRNWIKKIPDGSLAWFHWDPPYGGAEGAGGAFVSHAGIETNTEACIKLMTEMLPEIHRVLSDGSWLVMWYTPVHYHWLRLLLQGHRFSPETGCCLLCDRHIIKDQVWLSENYSCRKSPWRFWVNPYPNYWRKIGRVADGHEIRRFLTKETECFLFAGKNEDTTPVLMRSDRGNVFEFPAFSQHSAERRHVHHKPAALLTEILSVISVPGALGGDAGAGSGSILEGAAGGARRCISVELSPEFHEVAHSIALDINKKANRAPSQIAPWLEESFASRP